MIPWSLLRSQESEKMLPFVSKEFVGSLAVVPELVMVGDGGNLADPLTGLGAVEMPFQIGKYDTTTLQWSVFLNAVNVVEGNQSDPRHLYHPEMFQANDPSSFLMKATCRLMTDASTPYEKHLNERIVTVFFPKEWGVLRGHYYASIPMTRVPIDDAKRYCNWLHNGAPSFDELNATTLWITETGAYDFTNGKHGELMPGARYFIPSLNQWYKAAYYQAFRPNPGYWHYPTQGNKLPRQTASCCNYFDDPSQPDDGHYHSRKTGANYAESCLAYPHCVIWHYTGDSRGALLTTPVGLFKDSPGPYGTYDMGGNVRQWTSDCVTKEEVGSLDPKRLTYDPTAMNTTYSFLAPGGSYDELSDQLLSTNVSKQRFDSAGAPTVGFRIAALAGVSCQSGLNPADALEDDKKVSFSDSLWNVAIIQITSYGLEAFLSVAIRGKRDFNEIIAPFTWQRNITNTILSCIVASSATSVAQNINEATFWNISFIVASSILTMCTTEGLGFIAENFVQRCLEGLKYIGLINIEVLDSIASGSWERVFVNVYYILGTTFSTVLTDMGYTDQGDLEYFNEQQKIDK
jgi:formylglycine-generating enzyme required for sulfatase activity